MIMAPCGRIEHDVNLLVLPEDIEMGVASDKNACAIERRAERTLGVRLSVGVDDSGDSWPKPWASWESVDFDTGRTRMYSGDLVPADRAVKVITTNDVSDRKRLLRNWPQEGRGFRITNVTSRYKQTGGRCVVKSPTVKVSTTKSKGGTKSKPRKPRRTMRRYVSSA